MSKHDEVIYCAQDIYEENGMFSWANPGSEKNKDWNGFYIDLIVTETMLGDSPWLIEIETNKSINATEARNQWSTYDDAFEAWFLAVPVESEEKAIELITEFEIENCELVTWEKDQNGDYIFWGLPGVED